MCVRVTRWRARRRRTARYESRRQSGRPRRRSGLRTRGFGERRTVRRTRAGELRCRHQRRGVVFRLGPPEQDLYFSFRTVFLGSIAAVAASSAACAILRLAPLWRLSFGLVQVLLVIAEHFDGDLISLRFLRDEIPFSPLTDVSGEALFNFDSKRWVCDAQRRSRIGNAGDARRVRAVSVDGRDEVGRAPEDGLHPLGQHISVDDRDGQARD